MKDKQFELVASAVSFLILMCFVVYKWLSL